MHLGAPKPRGRLTAESALKTSWCERHMDRIWRPHICWKSTCFHHFFIAWILLLGVGCVQVEPEVYPSSRPDVGGREDAVEYRPPSGECGTSLDCEAGETCGEDGNCTRFDEQELSNSVESSAAETDEALRTALGGEWSAHIDSLNRLVLAIRVVAAQEPGSAEARAATDLVMREAACLRYELGTALSPLMPQLYAVALTSEQQQLRYVEVIESLGQYMAVNPSPEMCEDQGNKRGGLREMVCSRESSRAEGACLRRDYIFFGNGMFTTPLDAGEHAEALEQLVVSELGDDFDLSCVCFGVAYNNNESVSRQIPQVVRQRLGVDTPLECGIGTGIWGSLGLDCLASIVSDAIWARVSDLVAPKLILDSDLRRQVDGYLSLQRGNSRVIVVAHSQGNLYAEAACEALGQQQNSAGNWFGYVALAHPGSRYSCGPRGDNQHISSVHDFVINAVRRALPFTLRATHDNGGPLGTAGHDFVKDYLNGTVTGGATIARIRSLLASLRIPSDAQALCCGQVRDPGCTFPIDCPSAPERPVSDAGGGADVGVSRDAGSTDTGSTTTGTARATITAPAEGTTRESPFTVTGAASHPDGLNRVTLAFTWRDQSVNVVLCDGNCGGTEYQIERLIDPARFSPRPEPGSTVTLAVWMRDNLGAVHGPLAARRFVWSTPAETPAATVSSVSPTTAILNQATTFTVRGNNLPATLAFFLPECEGLTNVSRGTTEQQFRCTPSYTTGTKAGRIAAFSGGPTLLDFSVRVDAPPVSVSSVSPTDVTLGRETTFTVRGTNLPSSLAFFIEDCAGLSNVSRGTTEQRFRCTPSYSGGWKDGRIALAPGGSTLLSFDVYVDDPAPVVDSVSPTSVTLNSSTTFTVRGTNLPSTLAFFIPDCEGVSVVARGSSQQQFRCTPRYTTGRKSGRVADAPGGTTLLSFTVTVR